MKNKFLFLLISIFFLTNFNSTAQDFWELVPTPDSANLVTILVHKNGDIFIGSNGVYLSQDNGETWEFKGLFGRTIYSIDIDSLNNVYIGTTGRVFRSMDYGTSWEEMLLVLGNILSIKAGKDGLIFAGSGGQIAIMRSQDYGETWDTAFTMLETEQANDIDIAPNGDVFVGASAFMVPAGGVYRSQDSGDNWEHIGLNYHYVYAVETDNSSSVVYAGSMGQHYTGEIGFYKYDSTIGFWDYQKGNVAVHDIVISDHDDIYIGCTIEGGGHAAGVFRSFDGGESWEDLSAGLIINSVRNLAISPNHFLYATTNDSPNTLNRSVEPIVVSIEDSTEEILEVKLFPNPCKDRIHISFPYQIQDSQIIANLYSLSGALEFYKIFNYLPDNDLILDLDRENISSGIFFLQIIIGDQIITTKVIKY